jgi:GNAT superfamily N-acetyltransferase
MRLVGTLDVTRAPSLPGEVLIARCTNAAYMHNVCTDPAVRRRGVGKALVQAAIQNAREFGVH